MGNKIVDHSDEVGASPVGAAPHIFILDSTPGFNRLHKDNCKTRWETFKFWDLVCLILEIWWYTNSYYINNVFGIQVVSRNLHDVLVPISSQFCLMRDNISYNWLAILTRWGRDKIATILLTTFFEEFQMKIIVF